MSNQVQSQSIFLDELSVENIKLTIESTQATPVYGDFARNLSVKLNELFRRDKKPESASDQIINLGEDLTGNSEHYNYQLGRKDLIKDGSVKYPSTMMDTKVSVESVQTDGIGFYDITNEIASIVKYNPNTFIWCGTPSALTDNIVDIIHQSIVNHNLNVVAILKLDEGKPITDIEIESEKLLGLLESHPDNLYLYGAYFLEE